jgi:membrane protease YdiL (CAAX protease family)
MSWPATITLGVAIGISLKFIAKAIVLPLLGADPINHAYSYLIGNPAALPGILATVVVGGGVGEEIIWRGYLFERLAPLRRAGGAAAVLMVSTALFALAHYADQGWSGVQQALVTGLVFGGVFLATGRLWTGMIAHALFDVTAVLMIYWNAEEKVAHLIFH